MTSFNKDTFLVSGLPVWVYSSATSEPSKPVFILFFLHGRTGKAADLEPAIKTIFEDIANSKALDKDLVVVTLASTLLSIGIRDLLIPKCRTTGTTEGALSTQRQMKAGMRTKPSPILDMRKY